MTYATEVAADNPVDWYKMDTGTGTDSGSGSRTLTVSGVTTGVAGKVSNGWSFDGVNDYASMATFPSLTTAFTFEAWVKPNLTGVNDTPTVIRRDGTDIGLLRVRGSSVAVNPGQAEVYIDGTTLLSGSSFRVDDGNWHHLVYTQSGNAAKLYVDGVQRATATTGQSTFVFGSGIAYIGAANGTSEWYKGVMDEVAIYNTALSATRVADHFNAASSTSVTIDADVPTVTIQGITESFVGTPVNVTVDVTTVTTSVQANEATFAKVVYLEPSRDQRFEFGNQAWSESLNTIPLVGADGDVAVFDFELPSDLTNSGLTSAYLTLKTTGSHTATFRVRAVTSEWTNDFVPTSLSTAFVDFGLTAATSVTVNLTSLVDKNNFYGFHVQALTGSATFYASEYPTSSNRPKLGLGYSVVPEGVDLTADTVTASVAANDVTVEADADLSQTTATASLSAADVTVEVSTDPNVTVNVDTATVSLTAPDATIVQVATIDVVTATASVAANDVTVEFTSNAVIELDSPRILYTHIQVAEVQGEPIGVTEAEDPYFNSTMFNNPGYWHRFNDITRPPLPRAYNGVSKAELATYPGQFTENGVVIGLNDGPNGRKHVRFEGTGFFEAYEHFTSAGGAFGESGGRAPYTGTLEFSIRTTKKTQFLMRSYDMEVLDGQITTSSSSQLSPRDLWLIDGKLALKVWYANPRVYRDTSVETKWITFKDIADGDWHHIVLAGEDDPYGDTFTEPRMNIYIDGDFEMRRRGWGLGFPDYIGAYPPDDGRFGAMPQSEWYVGDVSEVVHYPGVFMSEDRIHVQYDNLFGFQPYYAESARATVAANDVTVKSNTKRILVINMDATSTHGLQASGVHQNRLTIDGVDFGFTGLGYGNLFVPLNSGEYQSFGVRATFPIQVTGAITRAVDEQPAYDDRTGDLRLIDLDVDVNLDDYDILHIINYPTNSDDMLEYEAWYGRHVQYGGMSAAQQIEKIINDVKQFAIDGGGVYVTDPMVAAEMGIIDDVESVWCGIELPDEGDFGASYNFTKDLRSAVINPWQRESENVAPDSVAANGPSPVTDQLKRVANFYFDNHANYDQRVVTLIDGLTDLPGDILVDSLAFSGYMPRGYQTAEMWKPRPDGLAIGDQFRIMGTPFSGREFQWIAYDVESSDARNWHFPATHKDDVKAGVVVTSFAEKTWAGNELVDNPKKDYAVSIAVRPGDLMDGQVMKGKIYVSFTEGFANMALNMAHSEWDLIPPNEELRPDWQENDYAREWSFSGWRGAWGATGGGSKGSSIKIGLQTEHADTGGKADETKVIISENDDKGDKQMAGLEYTHRFPTEFRDAPQMPYRGVKWLGTKLDEDGGATVGVETANVSAKANETTVEAQRSSDVTVPTARVITEAFNDADTAASDVTVLMLTPSVTVQAVPFTEAVQLETAKVTTRSYDDADGIVLSSDWVVLRLPNHVAYLTLEET